MRVLRKGFYLHVSDAYCWTVACKITVRIQLIIWIEIKTQVVGFFRKPCVTLSWSSQPYVAISQTLNIFLSFLLPNAQTSYFPVKGKRIFKKNVLMKTRTFRTIVFGQNLELCSFLQVNFIQYNWMQLLQNLSGEYFHCSYKVDSENNTKFLVVIQYYSSFLIYLVFVGNSYSPLTL